MSGVPGLGKTRLVRVFSQQLGLSFGRIQYTPIYCPVTSPALKFSRPSSPDLKTLRGVILSLLRDRSFIISS